MIQADANVYGQRPFRRRIGDLKQEKDKKTSDNSSIAVKLSDNFSEIALYKQFNNNDTPSRKQQFLSDEDKQWNTGKSSCSVLRKTAGETAINSRSWG